MNPPDNYPIEYIDWKVTFFGRDFVVTPDVLIPRLETEVLVKRARQILLGSVSVIPGLTRNPAQPESTESRFLHSQEWQIQQEQSKPTIVIDIGCGSGIIGTSVADLADEVIFLDISPEALRVTESNFRTHFPDKKAQFIVSDLLSAIPELLYDSHILLLANLPYIKAEDWINMSADTIHEPRLALFGWEQTGFEMYERLFAQVSGLQLTHLQLLCEFGFDQREIAERVLSWYPWQYSFFADYAGIERFAEIRF